MAFPTIPDFKFNEPDVFAVKIGTTLALATATGTGNPGLGQVKSISGRTTGTQNKKTFRRLSSATATTAYGSIEYESTCDIMLYSENDNVGLIEILNDAAEPVELNTATEVVIAVEVYDSISSGALLYTWYLTGAQPVEVGFDVDADGDAGMTPVRFQSTAKWILSTV